MIEVTLVSMGTLAEWGPGQIAPVAPLSATLCNTIGDQQYKDVTELTTAVVEKFCNFDLHIKVSSNDKVYLYRKEMLNLGILWFAFNDAIKDGDGDRVLRYWKLLLVVFKAKRHTNYAKEAIILLSQYHCRLSEHKAAQLNGQGL